MKVVFTVDNYFYKDENNNIYSKGLYPYNVWQRYLSNFDEIIVLARIEDIHSNQINGGYNLSSGPHVRFQKIPSLNSLKNAFLNKRLAEKEIEKIISENDCVIARIPSEISSLAIKTARKLNKPYATEVVSCALDAYWNHGSLKGKLFAPIAFYRTRKETRMSKFTLYVTESFLQKRYPTSGESINCSNVEIVSENLQLEFPSKSDTFHIGFIGFLGTNIKGLDTAMRALSLVKELGYDFQFHIMGGGDNHTWKKLASNLNIEENIIFYGQVASGKPVFNWIDKLDLYIHPSRQEGLPRAVIEVMSRGCPVIASRIGGIPELIDKNFLHEKNDYKTLSEKIVQFIDTPQLRKEVSIKNYNKSKSYTKNTLDKRRNEFWSRFRNEVETQ